MDSTSPNYFEYSVKRKKEFRLLRALIIFGIPFPSVIAAVIDIRLWIFFSLYFLFAILLITYLLRFTRQEFEYVIAGGYINFSVIYDNIKRRELLSVKISDMSRIVPYDEEYLNQVKNLNTLKRFDYCGSLKDENLYFFTVNHEKHGDIMVTFNAASKGINIMKFYNRLNTVVKNNLL